MAEQSAMLSDEGRRQQLERRQPNLRSMVYALFMTRRKEQRRADQPSIYYIDSYSPYLLSGALLLMLLCILDTYFTLLLIQHGSRELNPLLAWALSKHVMVFFGLKYSLTAICVVLTVMHKHFRVFGLKGYQVLIFGIVVYGILIQYQLSMLLPILF